MKARYLFKYTASYWGVPQPRVCYESETGCFTAIVEEVSANSASHRYRLWFHSAGPQSIDSQSFAGPDAAMEAVCQEIEKALGWDRPMLIDYVHEPLRGFDYLALFDIERISGPRVDHVLQTEAFDLRLIELPTRAGIYRFRAQAGVQGKVSLSGHFRELENVAEAAVLYAIRQYNWSLEQIRECVAQQRVLRTVAGIGSVS